MPAVNGLCGCVEVHDGVVSRGSGNTLVEMTAWRGWRVGVMADRALRDSDRVLLGRTIGPVT